MTFRKEVLAEGVEVWLGDCAEILPTLGTFDALVTDPPYGIGADKGAGKSAEKWTDFTGDAEWDSKPPDAETIANLLTCAKWSIIWGGNYFGLPPSSCWLIWDKETAGITTFADCEVAWTNLSKAMRLKRHLWSGPYMKVKEERVHPTQKPLAVMEWCVDQLPADALRIVDPYLRGRQFSGIERDSRYFDIACRRIEAASKQPDMFIETPAPLKQTSMFDGEAA